MIEVSVNVLILLNIVLLFLLVLLFIFLLLQKNKDIKIKNRKENLKNKLRVPLFNYLNEGDEVKTRLFQRDTLSYKVVQQLLHEHRKMAQGDEVSERIRTFAETYFAVYYRELLEHKSWSIRMNTLYSIENFMMYSLEDIVWEGFVTSGVEKVEQHQQLRVLARLQSKRLIDHLFLNNQQYPLAIYKEILRRFHTEKFDQIVSKYDQGNQQLKIALLALFAEKKDTSYLPLVERELENGQTDIRMQALKVIRSLGYTSNPDKLMGFAKSSLWQERMMYCKIASVIKKERFKPSIVPLISDENWWVRNAAGEAIVKLEDGQLILTHIAETSEDSFARDMALQWLGGEELRDE
ncbi:MAG: HEAT repeat domain-containing protein [Anaerobacillus sp.]|uniref:HEAT repeat domain-containing protein n=1 Tax=Anaerobacillus sp. TaxID=1872506 RepID=UPI003919A27B